MKFKKFFNNFFKEKCCVCEKEDYIHRLSIPLGSKKYICSKCAEKCEEKIRTIDENLEIKSGLEEIFDSRAMIMEFVFVTSIAVCLHEDIILFFIFNPLAILVNIFLLWLQVRKD